MPVEVKVEVEGRTIPEEFASGSQYSSVCIHYLITNEESDVVEACILQSQFHF